MGEGVTTIENYQFKFGDQIGVGGFGKVYKGKHIHQGTVVALKQCSIESDAQGFQAMREVKNFQKLDKHPHIVHLFDFYYRHNAFWFVMEYCDLGHLSHYMKKYTPGLDKKLEIMHQCASAVSFMHTLKTPIIHRDIKPANILLKRENGQEVVKITDFGLSKILDPDPVKRHLQMTHAGTPIFMAPEVFMRQKYDELVDVFSLGLVYLCMISFKPGDRELFPALPNHENMDLPLPIGMLLMNNVKNNKPSPEMVVINPSDDAKVISLKHLIRDMTAPQVKDRCRMQKVEYTISQITGHESKYADMFDRGASSSQITSMAEHWKPLATTSKASVQKSKVEPPPVSKGMDLMKEALDNVLGQLSVNSNTNGKKNGPYDDHLEKILKNDEKTQLQTKAKYDSSMYQHMPDLNPTSNIKQGDVVYVIKDEERIKLLQMGHGEYNDGMRWYLGKKGMVKERFLHVCKVQFDDGQVWTYHPAALYREGEAPSESPIFADDNPHVAAVSNKFKRFDVVVMAENRDPVKCLQVFPHTPWTESMENCLGVKGIVNSVSDEGGVVVEFISGDDFTIDPELLQHVDTSDCVIEPGDFVMVHNDTAKVKSAQQAIGHWNSTMSQFLGKAGTVQKVSDGKAWISLKNQEYPWSFQSLKLVAKQIELQISRTASQRSSQYN